MEDNDTRQSGYRISLSREHREQAEELMRLERHLSVPAAVRWAIGAQLFLAAHKAEGWSVVLERDGERLDVTKIAVASAYRDSGVPVE